MSAAFCRKPLRPVGNENPARDVTGENRGDFQRRRRGIFVENAENNSQAPSGAKSSGYAAPMGLEVDLAFGATNIPRQRRRKGGRPAGSRSGGRQTAALLREK